MRNEMYFYERKSLGHWRVYFVCMLTTDDDAVWDEIVTWCENQFGGCEGWALHRSSWSFDEIAKLVFFNDLSKATVFKLRWMTTQP